MVMEYRVVPVSPLHVVIIVGIFLARSCYRSSWGCSSLGASVEASQPRR